MLEPYYKTQFGELYHGHVLDVLKEMPDQSVNCCVTSPPYWGLRDYGTAEWVGGDPKCKHVVGGQVQDNKAKGAIECGVRPGVDASVCRICGAIRKDRQIGLESTPEAYVEKMVTVFDEVRRVLADDGTCWVNLGDSYNGYMANQRATSISANNQHARPFFESGYGKRTENISPKDLVGIPWRVALAMQSNGWVLRQDIIWHKPNPMPESVKDRCTKAHEYIFMLSKNQRYYCDMDAINEPAQYGEQHANKTTSWGTNRKHPNKNNVEKYAFVGSNHTCGVDGSGKYTRNKRSVWTCSTKPFSGAHFAVFPPDLIEPCIMAGCPKGGIVLDPFMGSGTTAIVAHKHDRKFVGIELNQKYLNEIAIPRIEAETAQLKLFSSVS